MQGSLLAASLLATLSATPVAFPWEQGYLELGPSLAQPLLFIGHGKTSPPPQGWSRQPLSPPTRTLWASRSFPPVQAQLTPGTPRRQGQTWEVPLTLRLNVPAPAILQLVRQDGHGMGDPLAINPTVRASSTIRPGQEFLQLSPGPAYLQRGAVLDPVRLSGRLLTLRRLESGKAVFSVPGVGEVERSGDPRNGFPDLAPVIPDPDLVRLKRTYEGQQVWGYGGMNATCFPTAQSQVGVHVPVRQAVRVKRVARLGRPMLLNVQGGFGSEVGRGADAVALTPLVFLLDTAPFGSDGSFAFSSEGEAGEMDPTQLLDRIEQSRQPGACGDAVPIYLLDTWAVERVFSRTAPSDRVPVEAPEDSRGLTRWQYAWLAGFPSSTFGTLSEVLRKPAWEYRNIPFPATVSFDASGRVQDVDVPRLP